MTFIPLRSIIPLSIFDICLCCSRKKRPLFARRTRCHGQGVFGTSLTGLVGRRFCLSGSGDWTLVQKRPHKYTVGQHRAKKGLSRSTMSMPMGFQPTIPSNPIEFGGCNDHGEPSRGPSNIPRKALSNPPMPPILLPRRSCR